MLIDFVGNDIKENGIYDDMSCDWGDWKKVVTPTPNHKEG